MGVFFHHLNNFNMNLCLQLGMVNTLLNAALNRSYYSPCGLFYGYRYPASSYNYSYTPDNYVGDTLNTTYSNQFYDNYALNSYGCAYGNNFDLVGDALSSVNGNGLYSSYDYYNNAAPIYQKSNIGSSGSLLIPWTNTPVKKTKSSVSKTKRKNTKNNENLTIQSTDSTEITNTGKKIKIGKAITKRIKQIARKINCEYEDLLGLIYCESSFQTVPKNWNGKSAVGLIQFTDTNIKDLNNVYKANLTKQKIAQMTALEQLDWVEKSLLRAKQIAGFPQNHKLTASELYAINYAPKNAKRSDYVTKRGDGLYEGNEGLDLDKNGKITHAELASKIHSGSLHVIA